MGVFLGTIVAHIIPIISLHGKDRVMKHFAVVTDSTSNLAPELAEEYSIPVIPLNVHWGTESYLDGVTLDSPTFYRWLRERREFPKTSQPSAGAFIDFFKQEAERAETDTLLGVFISEQLSGTLASAWQAKAVLAEERPDLRIEIYDSRSVSMGLGLQVLEAHRAAIAGKTVEEGVAAAQACYNSMHVIFAVDSLEWLHRGGRIGGAARLLGSALNLKPVLTVTEGRVEALEKVRSRGKSLRRVIDLALERLQGRRPTELAIIHAEAGDEVQGFREMIMQELNPEQLYIRVLTPAVGTHGGPGTTGIAFYTNEG
jgi:DegV family protein with EDD domain